MRRACRAAMLRSLASCALVAVSFVVGCSGGVASSDPFLDPSSTAPGSSTSNGSGSESSPTASEAAPLDVSGVTKVLLSDGVCGGRPGLCYGTDAFEVDFAKSTLTRTSCVERGTDPDTGSPRPTTTKASSRSLTAEELQRAREALARVRFTNDVSKAYDGYMIALTVTSSSGTQYYSPQATCGNDRFKTVVSGFDEVKKALYAL